MTDFVVVGGGIAGVSAAAHLARHGSVTLLEMESTLAYHTTGRSAAVFVVNYGGTSSRPLAAASRSFLESPPEGAADAPLLSPRGILWIADSEQLPRLATMAAEGQTVDAGSVLVDADKALDLVPALNAGRIAGGLLEPHAFDIDVAALHQAFVRLARRNGSEIVTEGPVERITRRNEGWAVVAAGAEYECSAVINAAGAWGDLVAGLAGLDPIGLQPMRRTAFMVPGHEDYATWPMVIDADQAFYFKPDGVQLLCSLAEEIPAKPGDHRPRLEDVALAIERINQATTLGIRSVNSQWTGLRTFAPDREMVIGEDPTAPGFFWLVGQGGTGIQTSPACGALLADLVMGGQASHALRKAGVDPHPLSPGRFRPGWSAPAS